MKRLLSLTALAFSIMLLASFKNGANAQVRAGISINYQTFYDELDPYGRWIDYPDYGYVWIPDCGPDFRPYSTNGHWVWSDEYDWMWVSDYDWGWAPFHYGRWMEDPYYGWIWVPGYEWSPAWVAWRDGGDYYGWAPLRPGFNIGINISLGGYSCPDDYWSFAPRRYITSPRIYDYCVPRRNNVTIINQTTIINNYNYNHNVWRTGPGRRDAERYAGRINSVRFRDANDPGRARFRGNEVSVYRPNVQRDNNRSFQPRRVQQYDRNRGRSDIGRSNGNNLPQRQGDINNRGFGRRGSNDERRFGNNENGNGISGRRNNVITRDRVEPTDNGNGNGRTERPNRQFEPRGNNNEVGETSPFRGGRRNRDNDDNPSNGNGNRRDIMQRNDNPGANNPIERRNIETQPGERRMQRREVFDRGNGGNGNGRQMDQPRQMEQPRRFEQPQNRQFEQRRVEQPQQPQQQRQMEQPRRFEPRGDQSQGGGGRQFERRNDNNEGGGGGNNGGGHGRRGR